MAWYDVPLIFFFLLGVLLIAFSSFSNKKPMIWGITLILATLIIKASLWFVSLI